MKPFAESVGKHEKCESKNAGSEWKVNLLRVLILIFFEC